AGQRARRLVEWAARGTRRAERGARGMVHAMADVELTRLALPPGGVYEPHVAIDPSDPSRIAVVATTPTHGPGLGRSIWCWSTDDGGVTWRDGRIVQPQLDGEGAADPLVSFDGDGAIVTVAMTRDRAYIDMRNELDTQQTRLTSPTIEERLQAWQETLAEQ